MPRPRKYTGGTVIISAMLPEDLVEQIDQTARINEMTRTDIVMQVLRQAFPQVRYDNLEGGGLPQSMMVMMPSDRGYTRKGKGKANEKTK